MNQPSNYPPPDENPYAGPQTVSHAEDAGQKSRRNPLEVVIIGSLFMLPVAGWLAIIAWTLAEATTQMYNFVGPLVGLAVFAAVSSASITALHRWATKP